MLYIVATPIGNLGDITLRALETLKEVNGIICEDSRRTSLLLNHYQIDKPLLVLNDFNESKMYPQILEKLKSGEDLALVSDAGTPLISDPGYKLIRECLKLGVKVDSLPGPASPIVALTLSGLPPDKFMFLGYLPEKTSKRKTMIESLRKINDLQNMTFIIFSAPFKLVRVLEEVSEIYGDIEITLAKELTKIYQEVNSKKVSEFLKDFERKEPRGEWILLLNLNAF